MMISSNKLISTEIKMKSFNEVTITELRNDLKTRLKRLKKNMELLFLYEQQNLMTNTYIFLNLRVLLILQKTQILLQKN